MLEKVLRGRKGWIVTGRDQKRNIWGHWSFSVTDPGAGCMGVLSLLSELTLKICALFIFFKTHPLHLTQKYFVYRSPGFPVLPIRTID